MTSRTSHPSTTSAKGTTTHVHHATYQDELDDALDQTFPASDPIAPGMTTRVRKPHAASHAATTGEGARTTGQPMTSPADASQARSKAKQKAHPAQPTSMKAANVKAANGAHESRAADGHASSKTQAGAANAEHRRAVEGTTRQAPTSASRASEEVEHMPAPSQVRSHQGSH